MTATNDTSFPERNRGWYQEDLKEINEPMRNLLQKYSRVSSSDIVGHVNSIVSVLSFYIYTGVVVNRVTSEHGALRPTLTHVSDSTASRI